MNKLKKQPDPIDIDVGERIRRQRKLKQMTQQQLSQRLGVTFQQIQKYEKGTNRVGASRLKAIAEVLEVPVSFFFSTEEKEYESFTFPDVEGFAEGETPFPEPSLASESNQLMRAFTKIRDPKLRRQIIDLTRALADQHAF